jgi:hypothetical protein
MAFSPTDPATAYSLWLQLRYTKRTGRRRWRSDWMPVLVVLFFFIFLLIFYAISPSNDAAEQAERIDHTSTALTNRQLENGLTP